MTFDKFKYLKEAVLIYTRKIVITLIPERILLLISFLLFVIIIHAVPMLRITWVPSDSRFPQYYRILNNHQDEPTASNPLMPLRHLSRSYHSC